MLRSLLLLCLALLTLGGCQSINSRLGKDSMAYADAEECPKIKMPADSMALSQRYDIPSIPGNKDLIITNNMPPDYY